MSRVVGGSILIVISMFMLLGFFNADLDSGPVVSLLTFFIAVVLPFAGGAGLIYSHYKRRESLGARREYLRQKTLEAEVLKLAEQKGGKLTVIEVVSELAIAAETAKGVLDSLAIQSIAEVEITDSGVIVYSFYDVSHLAEKPAAKGVLDV